MSRVALALLALMPGCTGTPAEVPLATAPSGLDPYARDVHPILEGRCATLDCHGDPGRPLRLFAETGLRAMDELRGQPITTEELEANARALAAVDPDALPRESLVLVKPLRGGVGHAGGVIWQDASDPQPACVVGWLAGSSASAAVVSACAAAAPEVALPPP